MREIALHILDIAENSVAADANCVTIAVGEDLISDRLSAFVQDNGRGMTAEQAAQVVDPFVTSRTTRKVGLGIPLLKAAAEACAGGLEIISSIGIGTTLTVEFQRNHIDRMPLGDLASTWLTLLVSYPQIHWIFRYSANIPNEGQVRFVFDDQPVKEVLGEIPFTEPDILAYLRESLEEGVDGVNQKIVAADTDDFAFLQAKSIPKV